MSIGDQYPEAVSRLLDGDLPPADARAAIGAIAADPALRDRVTVYRLVGDALRGNPFPDDGFSKRIFDRLAGAQPTAGYDPFGDD